MKRKQKLILITILILILLAGFSWGVRTVKMQEGQTIRLICPASQILQVGDGYIYKNGGHLYYKDFQCRYGLD